MKKSFRKVLGHCSIALIILLGGCAREKESFSNSEMEREFEAQFGFRPDGKATEIRCKIVRIGDTITEWMAFRCDNQIALRIAETDFTKIAKRDIYKAAIPDVKMRNPNAPDWWKTMDDSGAQELYYIYTPYKDGAEPVQSRFRYLWRDESSSTIFYYNGVWR